MMLKHQSMVKNCACVVLPFLSLVIASTSQEEPFESCSQAGVSSEAVPLVGQSALLQIKQKIVNDTTSASKIDSLSLLGKRYNPSGAAAPLTQDGYAAVADCCCQTEMLEFVRRQALNLNLEVCIDGALAGLVPFHTCAKGPQTFDRLTADLLKDSTRRCSWIAAKGSCKELPADCPASNGTADPWFDCGCSVSKATKTPFPSSTIGRDNLGGAGPDVDVAEELRFVNIFGVAQPFRWAPSHHYCMDVSRGETHNGNAIWLYDCLADGKWFNQQWTLPASGTGQIRWTPYPDKCVDVANTNDGTQLRIWDCAANHPNMQWTLPADGNGRVFLTGTPNKCIDVSGGSARNENKIQLWDCEASNQPWIVPKATDASDLVITALNAFVPPTPDGAVKLTSGPCPADRQYSKAECLAAAKTVGADFGKTSLDGGADGGQNGRPQGCTLNGGNVEWWGASDNALCGNLGFGCVCKKAGGNPNLKTDMANGFGSLALRRGTSTDFQFKFVVCGTSTPRVLEELHMAFYDLDKEGSVMLTSGQCPSDRQYSKAECLEAAKAAGANYGKTSLDGGADGGLNGRPQGCTLNGDNVEWWGASDNALCGNLGFNCICKGADGTEFVSSTGYKGYLVDGSTSLTASPSSDGRTKFSGSVSVPNPSSSASITDAQRKASVMFYYKDISEFVVTFGSEPLGTFADNAIASLMFSSDTDLEERCDA